MPKFVKNIINILYHAHIENSCIHLRHFSLHCAIAFSIILFVSKADRILRKMQNNPRDWRIDSLKTVARAHNIEWRQRGTSPVVFVRSDGKTLPVPVRRPIKPIYIKKFIELVGE